MHELILHIGMHKTGTTSIQSSLNRFDNGSVRYAQLSDVNHSIPIYTLFAQEKYKYHIHRNRSRSRADVDVIAQDTRDSLNTELALGRDRLIISGEDIALIDPAGVDAMANFFEQRVDRIRVLAYVRDPIGFASSALQQRIIGGNRQTEIPTPEYRKRFEKYIDRFGRSAVEFVGFSKSALNGASVVQDFYERIGIDHSSLKEKRANISATLNGIRMVYLFNRAGMKSTGNPQLMKTRKALIHQLNSLFEGPNFRLPDEIAAAAIDWDDVKWMEKASSLSLSESLQESHGNNSLDDPTAYVESLLTTVDPKALRCLQAHVAKIDQNLSQTNDPSALLNALYVATHLMDDSTAKPVANRRLSRQAAG